MLSVHKSQSTTKHTSDHCLGQGYKNREIDGENILRIKAQLKKKRIISNVSISINVN